jgi:hypothetical protein
MTAAQLEDIIDAAFVKVLGVLPNVPRWHKDEDK